MNSSTKIAISIFLGFLVVAAAVYLGLSKLSLKSKGIIEKQTSQKEEVISPSATSPMNSPSPTLTPTNTPTPTPAEITWTKSDILQALVQKTGIPEDKITFSISKEIKEKDKVLLRGGVSEKGAMGGAMFFAVVDKDGVKVTYAGNGVPLCSEVNPYGYPKSWADYCVDENGNTVKR